MANKTQVLETLRSNPAWNTCQIAASPGCSDAYARKTLYREGYTFCRLSKRWVRG